MSFLTSQPGKPYFLYFSLAFLLIISTYQRRGGKRTFCFDFIYASEKRIDRDKFNKRFLEFKHSPALDYKLDIVHLVLSYRQIPILSDYPFASLTCYRGVGTRSEVHIFTLSSCSTLERESRRKHESNEITAYRDPCLGAIYMKQSQPIHELRRME